MIIAVNTRLLLKDKLEGIGRFTFEILKRITKSNPEHTFIFIFDRKYDKDFIFSDNIIPVVVPPQSRHPLLWYIYFEYSVPYVLRKYKADLFLSTDGWVSLSTKVKTLNVIHDLHYERHPEFLPYLVKKYYQYFFPRFIKKANRICTVSEFSKNEIITTYDILSKKIDVVYNASRTCFVPISITEQLRIKNKYTQGEEYFLFIGPIHPRKNPENLIKAFVMFKEKSESKFKLVLVGDNMWRSMKISEEVLSNKYSSDIIFTGRISSKELHLITSSAFALTYVSFYEGFGIPILEAMSCNVPVIASETSSIPEVGGSAVMYVNPYSVNSIAEAMLRLVDNPELRNDLIKKGRVQNQSFSWDRSADIFWQSVLSTMES
jgi:glycosyltransferase involved in cell wall biosynthesis